ncbi:hypothetical protein HYH03_003559 [Edaphochlamys debaryana]|uniref:Uncharacterized protein n=1 Tax=Edaphochlamys debaryana TaxID=47281 RepID=A0A836C3Y6_9CHLO|nr:hypothetical protein HYH03_003559 [Edaphochlamys debaryana]|eukprot:KAG2498298.1 hypothetical protein HYH03_003559 [Edaphochlamys debaryana]
MRGPLARAAALLLRPAGAAPGAPAALAWVPAAATALGRRGFAIGSHPKHELDKIQRTAEGKIDITEDEPGTGDMPHMRTPSIESVEGVAAGGGEGRMPEFYSAESFRPRPAQPHESDPNLPRSSAQGSGDPTAAPPSADSGAHREESSLWSADPKQATFSSWSMQSGPHEGTNLDGSYGGPSQDYYHGAIPVVTDPVVGMATGSILGASAEMKKKLGAAVIRGRGEHAVGVNTKQPGTPVTGPPRPLK